MTISTSETQSSPAPVAFVERRQARSGSYAGERRQFGNSYNELTPEGRQLAIAIDEYKLNNRRRYITPDEMLQIVKSLGYSRPQ
jgi:hypothetical protein